MSPLVQPKCFRHPQHMRNNWELRKRGYLIRVGHTEALLFKKKDIKRPFFPPCRNWPIWIIEHHHHHHIIFIISIVLITCHEYRSSHEASPCTPWSKHDQKIWRGYFKQPRLFNWDFIHPFSSSSAKLGRKGIFSLKCDFFIPFSGKPYLDNRRHLEQLRHANSVFISPTWQRVPWPCRWSWLRLVVEPFLSRRGRPGRRDLVHRCHICHHHHHYRHYNRHQDCYRLCHH